MAEAETQKQGTAPAKNSKQQPPTGCGQQSRAGREAAENRLEAEGAADTQGGKPGKTAPPLDVR